MLSDLNIEPLLIQSVFSGDIDEVRTFLYKKADINYQNTKSRLSALHAAAHCAYADIVELLCSNGARVNSKDIRCLTPLHYACRTKSEETVQLLLKYQADVNARDRNWQTALHVCATFNAVNCAKQLIAHMQNIDCTDRQGRSALAYAAFSGSIQMVELLLENGANSNLHDKQERRPIHWATFLGYSDIIKILKKHGADINCIDKEHYTPLLVACASGKSEEIIRLLIELGSNVNATTIYDSSAFHLACLNGHEQLVKELIDNHNIQMKTNNQGFHPIHYASVSKRGAFCLELLIQLGVDVNVRSNDGKTPLHIAALHSSFSCAQILICNGATVDAQDNDNNTPLHLAAFAGHESMISILNEYGASINIRGSNGMLPFAIAALHGHSDCFKDLESTLDKTELRKQYYESTDDYGRTFLHLAAISGNVDCIDLCLNCGCNVNAVDKNGNTPLHYACLGSYMQCILSLITNGANLDIQNANGCSSLMYACASDSDGRAVRTLLNGRATATYYDKFGYNALHYAALQGNKKVMELLLDKCKQLNHQENDRKLSPLHVLAYNGYKDALETLASNFTNLDVCDNNGRTPIDLACFKGNVGCVECLLMNGANCSVFDSVNQRTPLHAAAYNNNEECIKLILILCNEKKELINARDKYKRTPLMIAVEQGHLSTILYLITQQADLDAIDSRNCTALHRAAGLGYEECCVLLLKYGASPYLRDSNGLLPIHYVILAGHANLIGIFLDYQYDSLYDSQGYSLLHYACFNGHSTCVETLYECQLIPDTLEFFTKPGNRCTPLHCAAVNGHETCLSFLLQRYGNKIVELENKNGCTALHICAINNEIECTQTLIQYECNINALTIKNETPLMLAAENNAIQVIELLIDLPNININQLNIDNNNALHLALLNQHETAALILLDKINDPLIINQQNLHGVTALHVAASNGFYPCVEALLSKGANIFVKNNKSHTPLLSCAKNDQVADCMELMLSKILANITDPLYPSLSIHQFNDSNNENSNNAQRFNNFNTTCVITTNGPSRLSVNEEIKDNSVHTSDSEFF